MYETMFFFLYYAIVLLLGAVIITGWFAITRGEWYKNPDDTPYWSGKLFSPWLRFWTQEYGKEKFYYRGSELETVVGQITNLLGIKDYTISDEQSYLVVNGKDKDLLVKKQHYLFQNLQVVLVIKSATVDREADKWLVFMYREYPLYTFPHWLRSPLATCLYCHGSIYGSLVWWLSAWIVKDYFHLPFEWRLFAVFWVPFMISQSFVAPYLNKKL